MIRHRKKPPSLGNLTSLLNLAALLFLSSAQASQLTLTWTDNSANESGFRVERKLGTNGSYAQIAAVSVNSTSYVDASVTSGSTYCYHVSAYNSAGNSSFSNESCGTAPATPAGVSLNVTKSGTGSGTVSSNPAGITCGTTCSTSLPSGTQVSLTAVASDLSVFSGWSGGGCSGTGNCTVTLNSNITVTATFNPKSGSAQNFSLSVTKNGTGSGTVSSNPAGITCGSTCSASLPSSTSATLTATTGDTSVFSGWTGGGCSGTGTCTVTLNSNVVVTATFNPKSGSAQNFSLSVTKNGTGSGTVSSNPAGITCGSKCSASFPSATSVALTATASSGSVFSSWGGGCTGIGICTVKLNSNTAVTATFTVKTASSPAFTLSVTKNSNDAGTVSSNPAGITCGSKCSASYPVRTRISLSATPNSSSAFDHWAGGCTGTGTCSVKLGADTQVIAYFKPKTTTLTVQKMGQGSGTITSTELGISCGAKCSENYSTITAGTVTAKAAPGSIFAGWIGVGCESGSTCAVLVSSDTTIAASFVKNPSFHLGVFRANSSQWFVDLNGNGTWEDCSVDLCFAPFGKKRNLPVTGDWDGSGFSRIGVFNPGSGTWQLDLNGNGTWEDCSVDLCLGPFGQKGDLPVTGDWDGSGFSRIGVFNPGSGTWQLDLNGNGTWEDCSVDLCLGPFGQKGDLPVTGDWDGSGFSRIGVFNPGSGTWQLDLNGNGTWEGCSVDLCLGPFGQKGDLPVTGDWDGSGFSRIGVFNPGSGTWQLDLNGNGTWEGCSVDLCLGPFGQKGDLPIVGSW